MVEYTTSQLACFKNCPKKWYYRFFMMLDSISIKRNLELGSYVHHLLDVFYQPEPKYTVRLELHSLSEVAQERYLGVMAASEKYFKQKTENLFEEEMQQFIEMRQEVETIVTRYIEQNAEDLQRYKVISTEKEFCVPIYNNNGKRTRDKLRGKLDMLVEDMYTTIWFFEHKTTSDSVDNRFETVELEEQLNNYILVTSGMYEDYFGGGILNVIRKKAPRLPEPLKRGGLSRDKKIDTTFDLYMEALEKYGYNPAEYSEILGILKEKGDRFFGRKIVSRKSFQILETRDEIYFTIQIIKELTKLFKKTHNPAVFYRTPSFMCGKFCQYCNLCILDSKKGDVDSYIAGNFVKREVINPELTMEIVDASTGMQK